MRARNPQKCEPMLPPAPATTIDLSRITLCLRHPVESGVQRCGLRAEPATRRVSPAGKFIGLVIHDAALAAHRHFSVPYRLTAAPAKNRALSRNELFHTSQRL